MEARLQMRTEAGRAGVTLTLCTFLFLEENVTGSKEDSTGQNLLMSTHSIQRNQDSSGSWPGSAPCPAELPPPFPHV